MNILDTLTLSSYLAAKMAASCCFVLGSSFSHSKNLYRHMKEIHNRKNLPIENCDMCDYVGIWPNLVKHMMNFHGNKVIWSMCDTLSMKTIFIWKNKYW